MINNPKFKIESFIPNYNDLNTYAIAFKERMFTWTNNFGEQTYFSSKGYEQENETLKDELTKVGSADYINLLKKYEVIPEKLFRIAELPSGASKSMPIYTGIRQISLEGQGSILAEAFFGAEIHLLDITGQIVSVFDSKNQTELGLGQLCLIDYNNPFDNMVEGIEPDPKNIEIIQYAPEKITRCFTFNSEYGRIYKLNHKGFIEQTITGTGKPITVNNLKNIGRYSLTTEAEIGKFNKHFTYSPTIYSHHVGIDWKDITDFTIHYNTFPSIHQRDQWVMQKNESDPVERFNKYAATWQNIDFIESELKNNPYCFQFMPKEIRSNKEWIKKACTETPVNFLFVDNLFLNDSNLAIELIKSADKSEKSIYPYLPESLRKDLDILIIMKKTGRLFDLPNPKEISQAKCNDIRNFINKNHSRLDEIIKLFPKVIHFFPDVLRN